MKIDSKILDEFETLIDKIGLFGTCTLAAKIHDGHIRYTLTTEKHIIPGKETSGAMEVKA